MKTKARNRIIDNIVSETKQEAPYQDDELVGLQEVLELDPNVINESLADVDGGGEQIDADLLKKLDLVEPNEDECMLSENDIESDFDDTDTSMKEYRWHPQEERAIRAIFETKGSRILKNAMNKIRNGQDKGKWITANVRAALDEHWGSTDFLNKSSTAKANRSVDRGASAYCGDGIENHVNDAQVDRPHDMGNDH
ncbi:hypothetical protein JHK87_006707 [Glycine soja]|nr:hypothetical protein JHK87_006707 [Glycine soja]